MTNKPNKMPSSFARLCRTFNDQAGPISLSIEDVWHEVEQCPWINSHPWSYRGVPSGLNDAVFNVKQDIRREYVRLLEGYDKDNADLHSIAATKMMRLLQKQSQEDLDYLLLECSQEQQMKMLHELNLFYETNVDDPDAPYYGTGAVITAFCMAQTIETYLTRGYQSVYGPRNF